MSDRKLRFLEHIVELRKRLLVTAAVIAATATASFFFAVPLLKLMLIPAEMNGNPLQLVYLSPLEPFMVKMKIALFCGVALAMPVIFYQLIAFIAPALRTKEKKIVYPSIVLLVILFFSGVVFGYKFIMPVGTQWLLNQAGEIMRASVSASQYVTYAGWFLLGFGISFETPLFILLLVRLGILKPAQLRKSWRYSLVIILLLAAVITPDWSPVTMAIMAGPMLIFYLLSVLVAPLVAPKPKLIEEES